MTETNFSQPFVAVGLVAGLIREDIIMDADNIVFNVNLTEKWVKIAQNVKFEMLTNKRGWNRWRKEQKPFSLGFPDSIYF